MEEKKWADVLRAGFFAFPEIRRNILLPAMVALVGTAMSSQLGISPIVRNYFKQLPKGPGTFCPDSPVEELQNYAASRTGMIDKSSPWINLEFMKKIMVPVAAFEREMILKGLQKIENASPDEISLLTLGSRVAREHDYLWLKWYKEVAVPFHSLPAQEREGRKKELGETLNKYDYTSFTADGTRVAWAVVFPDEIRAVIESIGKLEQSLSEKSQVIEDYLRTLALAYACRDVGRLEERWADVDRTWIAIPADCRVFPVHGMESGYDHPFGVSSEFRIMVRTAIGTETIGRIKNATFENAGSLGADMADLKQKLGRMDMGVFQTAIWSGRCLNSRFAGQVVPNRQDIRAQGGKIFVDEGTVEFAVENYQKTLAENFLAETAGLLKPLITAEGLFSVIAAHECFHPVGCTQQSDKAIEAHKGILEETKATLGGLLTLDRAFGAKGRLSIAAFSIARFCRFFKKAMFDNPSNAPYTRECMAICCLMHKAGVICLSKKGLILDFELAAGNGWLGEIEHFVRQIIFAYKTGNKELIEELCQKYCQPREFVQEAINWINKRE